MRLKAFYVLLSALLFLLIEAAQAHPGAEMKASPLFKASLESSIASLEAEPAGAGDTSEPGCNTPNAPIVDTEQGSGCTEYEGCSGGGWPTESTCQGSSTCDNTCSSTCYPGVCENYKFSGKMWWYDNYYGGTGNWWVYPGRYLELYNRYPGVYNNKGGLVQVQFGDEDLLSVAEWDILNGDFYGTKVHSVWNSGWSVWGKGEVSYYESGPNSWYIMDGKDFQNPPLTPPSVNQIDDIFIRLFP